MWHRTWQSAAIVSCIVGCGSARVELNVVPAAGVVTLDDQPLINADVTAIPLENTPGLGGSARTDEQGKFQLLHARGEQGLPPGEYKLTVSLRKRKDGSVPPLNDPTPPIESDAVETLSPAYSDPQVSKLTASVTDGSQPLSIKLTSSQK